jgi:hypothetical protein
MADKKKKKAEAEAAALVETFAQENLDYKLKLTKEQNEKRRYETRELRLRTEKHVHAQIQIVEHLRAYLDNKHSQIKAVSRECYDLQRKLEQEDMENDKEELNRLAAEFQNAKQLLLPQIQELKIQNEEFLKYEKEEASLQEKLQAFNLSIEQEKLQLGKDLANLETKNALEKDKLKNEMLRKIRETKLSLLEMTQGKFALCFFLLLTLLDCCFCIE